MNKHPFKIKVENWKIKNKATKSKGYIGLEDDGELEKYENHKDSDEINNFNNDSSSENNKESMVKFSDIVIKFFLKHIDKITLVFIYLIAIEKVNIIHFSN